METVSTASKTTANRGFLCYADTFRSRPTPVEIMKIIKSRGGGGGGVLSFFLGTDSLDVENCQF